MSNRSVLVAADRAHLALLEHAQELDLQLDRHLADLVEEQRAAVRLHEETRAAVGVGERAAHVTEQLALEERLGDGAAVDGDERPLRAPALVESAGDQLFAGAAFAGDERPARVSATRAISS